MCSQKNQEWIEVAPLLRKLHVSKRSVRKGERPDFLMPYRGKHVGLELTECWASRVDGGNTARIETILCHTIERYQAILAQREEHSIVTVYFNTSNCYSSTLSEAKLTVAIINEIEKYRKYYYLLKNDDRCCYLDPINKALLDDAISNGGYDYYFIESLEITECPPEIEVNVIDFPKVKFCSEIEMRHLEPCIQKKEGKLLEYKAEEINSYLDEYWLLITVPFSEFYCIDGLKTLRFKVSSNYDRLYLSHGETIIRLK